MKSTQAWDSEMIRVLELIETGISRERIAEKMSEGTGQKVTRQEVLRWTHPDPSRRTEPRWSTGALLLGSVLMLQLEDDEKVNGK